MTPPPTRCRVHARRFPWLDGNPVRCPCARRWDNPWTGSKGFERHPAWTLPGTRACEPAREVRCAEG